MCFGCSKEPLRRFFLVPTTYVLVDQYEFSIYSKTCLKRPLKKKTKIGFQDRLLLNAGKKHCRMLKGEHSAILSSFIKLPFVFKTLNLSIFEWLLKTDFTVFRLSNLIVA